MKINFGKDFFNELTARNLGKQDILIVAIPQISAKLNWEGGLDFEATLPAPEDNAYTNTRDGRRSIEAVPCSPLSRLADVRGEIIVDDGFVRGMAGGIVPITNDSFILQLKHYPKTGDKYFSCFSGLSGSLAEIQNPDRIIPKEALEELVICDHQHKILHIPNFAVLGASEDLEKTARTAAEKIKSHSVSDYSPNLINIALVDTNDFFSVVDYKQETLSRIPCVLDLNPKTNGFDILRVVHFDLPKGISLYAPEFGNNVVIMPFEQMQEIWRNWGKEISIYSHLPTGETRNVLYRGLFDSLVQKVAIDLRVIEGPVRFDYKDYKKSI